jgi:hypothetical protein
MYIEPPFYVIDGDNYLCRRIQAPRFDMRRSCGIDMEVVVIGNTHTDIVKELRQRGVKVVTVPGNMVLVYKFDPYTGFQELDGDIAERYISLLLESPYFVEYF